MVSTDTFQAFVMVASILSIIIFVRSFILLLF